MENYFQMNFDATRLQSVSTLGLAHIGDAVFEVLCRGYLCCRGGKRVDNLHRATVAMVKAPAQAAYVEKLLPHLTPLSATTNIRQKFVFLHDAQNSFRVPVYFLCLLQPFPHATVSIGSIALLLMHTNDLCQISITSRLAQPFDIVIIAAT